MRFPSLHLPTFHHMPHVVASRGQKVNDIFNNKNLYETAKSPLRKNTFWHLNKNTFCKLDKYTWQFEDDENDDVPTGWCPLRTKVGLSPLFASVHLPYYSPCRPCNVTYYILVGFVFISIVHSEPEYIIFRRRGDTITSEWVVSPSKGADAKLDAEILIRFADVWTPTLWWQWKRLEL